MSMSPAMTGVFVKAWNAYPPESGIKADTGLIIDYPQFKRLQVVLFSNGCRVEIPTPTRWLFLKLMKDWHGEPQENET